MHWRSLAVKAFLVVLALGLVCAAVEYFLERRDVAHLTASESFHSAHGRRIRYHLTGRGFGAPTVVLVNGLTASLEQWGPVQAALSTHSPVLSYDSGGSGFSDPADGHDAIADADELYQLLQSPEIPKPIVLVGFSSSGMMAIVFAARYPETVKGLVFVDPTLRSRMPGAKTYRRIYLRPSVVGPLEAFFGLTRLKRILTRPDGVPDSETSKRVDAILSSTHHWVASAYTAMNLDKSADEVDAALATGSFADLPIGILTITDPTQGADVRDFYEQQLALAAKSKRGILRPVRFDHSVLLNDPASIAAIVDLTRLITHQARGSSVAGLN